MTLSCEKGRIESGTWAGNVTERYEKDTKCLARDLFCVMTKKGDTASLVTIGTEKYLA